MTYRVPPLRRAITKVPALDTVTGGSLLALLRQSIEGRNGPRQAPPQRGLFRVYRHDELVRLRRTCTHLSAGRRE
jgi:hypothetical protein